MTRETRGRIRFIVVGVVFLALGIGLRIWNWDSWPPGPWIDEAYAIRSARIVMNEPGHPVFGSYPLTPPDAGFVNYYSSNLYLYVSGAIDRLAGGGILSFRLLSIAPSILLLLLSVLLAHELFPSSPWLFGLSSAWLATSMWLLTTGRWGWIAVSTGLLLVMSLWLLVRALRLSSTGLAVASGVFLGIAQYGYISAWLVLPLPFIGGALALLWKDRQKARLHGLAALASLLVAAPFAFHLWLAPSRATARTGELLVFRQPLASQPRLLAQNAVAYARLFASGGDRNERHGSPDVPVLPPVASLLCLAGAVTAIRRRDALFPLVLCSCLILAGGLLSYEGGEPNSFRISLAAPFLLLLAAHGARAIMESVPEKFSTVAKALLAGLGVFISAAGVTGFLTWASSERLFGAFGGPERSLADAIAAVRERDAAPVFLDPVAVRNHHIVDTLLRDPASSSPAVRLLDLRSESPLGQTANRDVLVALCAQEDRAPLASALGARAIAQGGSLPGFPGWILYAIPRERR